MDNNNYDPNVNSVPPMPEGIPPMPQTAAPAPQQQYAAPQAQAAAPAQPADKPMIYSIMAYILIFWIVGLVMEPEKDMPYVKNHVNNGLIIFIAELALTIVGFLLGLISGVLAGIISGLLGAVILLFIVLGIMKAVNHQTFEFPFPFLANLQIIK